MATPFAEATFWLLLAVLWWLFYWPYRRYRVDKTRYDLFVIRDRLFDVAAEGALVDFDHPAYGMTRTTLNGMLRTIEDYSFIRWGALFWRASHDQEWRNLCARHATEFKRAIEHLSPEGRREIERAMNEAQYVFIHYAIWTSLTTIGLYAASMALRRVSNWSTRLRKPWQRIKLAVDYESNVAGRDDWRPRDARVAT